MSNASGTNCFQIHNATIKNSIVLTLFNSCNTNYFINLRQIFHSLSSIFQLQQTAMPSIRLSPGELVTTKFYDAYKKKPLPNRGAAVLELFLSYFFSLGK